MSAKSHINKKPMRNSAMEALGFTERPSVSYVEKPQVAASRLVSSTTRTGLTVAEMWDTTELEADSMVDWRPLDVDQRRLDKRVRWPFMVMWLVIAGGIAVGGYWVWQAPANGAAAAVAVVTADSEALANALDPLETATDALLPGQNLDSATMSDAATDVDDASRQLFASSGDLPASESASRTAASDAATQALDASKKLTGLAAYIGAVTQIVVAPTLITDPALVTLETAVFDFGEWRNEFDGVRARLPEGSMSAVTRELALVSARLESIQNAYVDALRNDDQQAALTAVRDLEGMLTNTWSVLLEEADSVKQGILDRIDSARGSLGLLPG